VIGVAQHYVQAYGTGPIHVPAIQAPATDWLRTLRVDRPERTLLFAAIALSLLPRTAVRSDLRS
jgi:hypothetical protein